MLSVRRGFTLIELLVVVVVLALLIEFLLPTLSKARKSAVMSKMASEQREATRSPAAPAEDKAAHFANMASEPGVPLARVSAFDAQIELTPRLSVGTAEAESIYEAKFEGKIKAASASGDGAEVQVPFPLPPQIISLADLVLKVNGEPSDAVQLAQGRLVWHGKLPAAATPIELTYTAMGKGVYALDVPPGGKLETFKIDLASVGSDVRMLELSLQPTKLQRVSGKTLYNWDYNNLIFGRPIALDVLGIAPIDRLGELSWLGPLSVVMFGLLVGLFARAHHVENFDRWMLLLIIGTFAGAYPLMYFAQEYAQPTLAIILSGVVVIAIIATRSVTIMGLRAALAGAIIPATSVMTLTLLAALDTRLQGILLTIGGLGFFIVAMMLAPRLKLNGGPKTAPAVFPSEG